MEYLEERYPEPALLPADPAAPRARAPAIHASTRDLGDAYYAFRRGEDGAEERLAHCLSFFERHARRLARPLRPRRHRLRAVADPPARPARLRPVAVPGPARAARRAVRAPGDRGRGRPRRRPRAMTIVAPPRVPVRPGDVGRAAARARGARDDRPARSTAAADSIDGWATSLLDELDGSFVVVGASMGGDCALAIARLQPDRRAGDRARGRACGAGPPERRAAPRDELIEQIRAEGAASVWAGDGPPASADELIALVEALRDRPDDRAVVDLARRAAPRRRRGPTRWSRSRRRTGSRTRRPTGPA